MCSRTHAVRHEHSRALLSLLAELDSYTQSMTMTTIKVSMETRDRLKTQAQAANRSLGGYLDDLADLADQRARLAAMGAAMASTSEADMREYLAELGRWEATDDLD